MRSVAPVVGGLLVVGSACGTNGDTSPTTTDSLSTTNEPSVDVIVKDLVNALPITSDQRRCMLRKLDNYDEDTLVQIGTENENIELSAPDAIDSGSPALQAFVADLRDCMTSDAGPTTTGP